MPRLARVRGPAVSLELLSLTAQSPLDGRYGRQTAELREGKAARDAFWGGVQLAHSF